MESLDEILRQPVLYGSKEFKGSKEVKMSVLFDHADLADLGILDLSGSANEMKTKIESLELSKESRQSFRMTVDLKDAPKLFLRLIENENHLGFIETLGGAFQHLESKTPCSLFLVTKTTPSTYNLSVVSVRCHAGYSRVEGERHRFTGLRIKKPGSCIVSL
jgi:hypothetical protein